MASWNQPQIGADVSRAADARRIVDCGDKASAVSWPTPEKVINRGQAAAALAVRRMSASIAATPTITVLRVAINPRMAAKRPATPSLALRDLLKAE
jgi:hypothetical protein